MQYLHGHSGYKFTYAVHGGTEEQQVKEISCATSERALLQHSRVFDEEKHVEQKIDAKIAEEEKIGQQPPYLRARVSGWQTVNDKPGTSQRSGGG